LLCDREIAATESGRLDRLEILQRLFGPELCRKLGIYRLPDGFRLSVVIPVYNEIRTLAKVIERVRATGLPLEIVIVDDGSRDGSREYLTELRDSEGDRNRDLKIILHERNQGKGGALKTGFLECTGDAVIIQDADLEYDPQDYHALLQPLVEGQADVVFGSRFSHIDGAVHHYWHRWGNQLITKLSNWRTGRAWTDVETCYKLVRRDLLQRIAPGLQERGFGIELELAAKLARQSGVRFFERPVSYVGRSWADGKKIGVKDGIWAMWCILRY
jgi:glycosyltransferase involved in cell wall biosynthesis